MANYYSIKIPEPCHEGWNTMSPKDKGRFCSSCSKTVVDFTKMDTLEIQDYLIQNKDQRICGHIKQTQLDSINIRVPLDLIQQKHSIYKAFFLALIITMGTSIFSCSSKNGAPKKIDSIEVIDTTKNEVIDVLGMITPSPITKDSIVKKKACKAPLISPRNLEIDGMIEIETIITGDIIATPEPIDETSLNIEAPLTIGKMSIEENFPKKPYNIHYVDELPKFKDTPKDLSKKEELKYFQAKLSDFVKGNFGTPSTVNLDLKGKQKIYAKFIINTSGGIEDIEVRAPHPAFEKETISVINKLPLLTPARNTHKKATPVSYILPIFINVE